MPDRIIRESICSSDTIDRLTWFEEVFWHRLTVNCDDFGRFDARSEILKGRLFPLKEDKLTKKSVDDALNKLATVGLVTLYVCDGRPYLQLVTWEKYQRKRAIKSKYPDPPDPDNTCCQLTSNAPVFEKREARSESIPAHEDVLVKKPEKMRHKHGQYSWVMLTDAEYQRLVSDFGDSVVSRYITYVDEYAQSNQNKNKYKDWNLVVRKAIRDKWGGGSLSDSEIKKSPLDTGYVNLADL